MLCGLGAIPCPASTEAVTGSMPHTVQVSRHPVLCSPNSDNASYDRLDATRVRVMMLFAASLVRKPVLSVVNDRILMHERTESSAQYII